MKILSAWKAKKNGQDIVLPVNAFKLLANRAGTMVN
jgi:hypothetical protein